MRHGAGRRAARASRDRRTATQISSCTPQPSSYIEIVRHTQRNVKRWQDGDMRKRWTAAGMLVAEQQFRRIIGYRHLAKLIIAIERRDRGKAGLPSDPVAMSANSCTSFATCLFGSSVSS